MLRTDSENHDNNTLPLSDYKNVPLLIEDKGLPLVFVHEPSGFVEIYSEDENDAERV